MINYCRSIVTKTNAYICIFVDEGLGGTLQITHRPQKSICCVTDEFSAINCLETIKQGLEVQVMVGYETRENLIHVVKILDKILLRMLKSEVELEFHKICKNFKKFRGNLLSKIL